MGPVTVLYVISRDIPILKDSFERAVHETFTSVSDVHLVKIKKTAMITLSTSPARFVAEVDAFTGPPAIGQDADDNRQQRPVMSPKRPAIRCTCSPAWKLRRKSVDLPMQCSTPGHIVQTTALRE